MRSCSIKDQFADEFNALSAEFSLRNSAFFVALSGGMDSCVLLDLMAELATQKNQLCIKVLHFDHGLQEQSRQWSEFCKNKSEQHGFDFLAKRKKVIVDKSIGLEASASNSRYQWFKQVMQQCLDEEGDLQHAVLLTAHHSDDQAETMLMNMLRGTGIKGLRGIAEKKHLLRTEETSQSVMRPLLSFSKNQIQNYAEQRQLQWCEDPSNQETYFRRNAIRHLVLPELKKIRLDVVSQFQKLSRRAVDTQDLLNELAYGDLALTEQYDWCLFDRSYGLSLAGLRAFSISRQINAIKVWLDLVNFPAESEADLLQILDWSINGVSSGAQLNRGKRCYRYYQDVLYVMPSSDNNFLIQMDKAVWADSSSPFLLNLNEEIQQNWQLCCKVSSDYYAKSLRVLSLDKVDEVLLPGGQGHIKAKQRFQSEKVPVWRRKQALFIATEDGQFIGIIGGQKLQDFYFEIAVT